MPTHYETLQTSPSASLPEIKKKYQKLILEYHPDKASKSTNVDAENSSRKFQAVVDAWEVLKNEETRREYDERLKAEPSSAGPIHAEIDLDDMEYDESTATFHTPCRCGGTYLISENDLESHIDTSTCGNCSLRIKILYEICEDGKG